MSTTVQQQQTNGIRHFGAVDISFFRFTQVLTKEKGTLKKILKKNRHSLSPCATQHAVWNFEMITKEEFGLHFPKTENILQPTDLI